MLSMAKAAEGPYQKYVQIMKSYEKGELLGHEARSSDALGGLKAMKLFYF